MLTYKEYHAVEDAINGESYEDFKNLYDNRKRLRHIDGRRKIKRTGYKERIKKYNGNRLMLEYLDNVDRLQQRGMTIEAIWRLFPYNIERIQKWATEQRDRYYLLKVRDILAAYLKCYKGRTGGSFYDYTDDGKLIICNGYSVVVLDDDSILYENVKDAGYVETKRNYDRKFRDRILELMDKYEQTCNDYVATTEFEKKDGIKTTILVSDQSRLEYEKALENGDLNEGDKPYSVTFNTRVLDYSERFLGDPDELHYEMSNENPACLITSPKGKALVLGIRD